MIDGTLRPSIDTEANRQKTAAETQLEDRFDEIAFSQSLMKEDISQQLEDISETTAARLRMLQRSIANLQRRMHSMEVAREVTKNEKAKSDEAMRSFIGTWFQMSREDVDTCFPSVYPPPY